MDTLLIWQRFQKEYVFAPLFELYSIPSPTENEKEMLENTNMAFINSSTEHPDSKKLQNILQTKWKDYQIYLSTDTPIDSHIDSIYVSGIFE